MRRIAIGVVVVLAACDDIDQVANDARCRVDPATYCPETLDAGARVDSGVVESADAGHDAGREIQDAGGGDAGARPDGGIASPDSGTMSVDAGGPNDAGSATTCRASSCPTGCCDTNGQCVTTGQTTATCGSGGSSCAPCSMNETCTNNTCVSVNQCATSWRLVDAGTTLPPARMGATLVYDPDQQNVVLFGGNYFTFNRANDLWVWNGTTWSEPMTSSTPPSKRRYHSAAYDLARKRMVVFGGDAVAPSLVNNETWEWDAATSTWTHLTPALLPGPRSGAAMAYDAARGLMVLFGGRDASGTLLNDTWVWNGVDWLQKSPAHSPPPRVQSSMAFDNDHMRVVLVAGSNGTAQVPADAWAWDGNDWTSLPSLPQGTDYPLVSYDPDHSRMVLFAYFNPPREPTFEFEGTQWNSCVDPGAPTRTLSSLAYDVARSRLLLFGGLVGGGTMTSNQLYERAP